MTLRGAGNRRRGANFTIGWDGMDSQPGAPADFDDLLGCCCALAEQPVAPQSDEPRSRLWQLELRLAQSLPDEALLTELELLAQSTEAFGERALSGASRARIALGRAADDLLVESRLPAWETAYLRGLDAWRQGALEPAADQLACALKTAPDPGLVQLAMARLPGAVPVRQALEWLTARATAQAWRVAALWLARGGRVAEAAAALSAADAPAVRHEPLRYTWYGGEQALRTQATRLAVGLAEQRGDWSVAERLLRDAELPADLVAARQRRNDALELSASPTGWRADRVRARLARVRRQDQPMLNGAARFFAAEGDLAELLADAAWVEPEQAVGGGRLPATARLLARLGDEAGARRAAELARDADDPGGPWSWGPKLGQVTLVVPADPAAKLAEAAALSDSAGELARALCEGQPSPAELPAGLAALCQLVQVAKPDARAWRELADALGHDWLELSPIAAESLARGILHTAAREQRWSDLSTAAAQLADRAEPWAAELRLTAGIVVALQAALAGDLSSADEALRRLVDDLPPVRTRGMIQE